jgi:hypothetical protein
MKTFYEMIDEINQARAKIYFNLAELGPITGLSIRMLKYRMKDVKKRYENVPSLLSKVNREWQIHYSIIDEFQPKYNLHTKTIYTLNWKTFTTWSPKFSYDSDFHEVLLSEIKQHLENKIFMYSVEKDERGFNHIHFVSDAEKNELHKAIEKTLSSYSYNNMMKEFQIEVAPIQNKYCSIEYLRKAPVAIGIMEGDTPLGDIVPKNMPIVTRLKRTPIPSIIRPI